MGWARRNQVSQQQRRGVYGAPHAKPSPRGDAPRHPMSWLDTLDDIRKKDFSAGTTEVRDQGCP
jgi:hypothetical protein